MADPTSQVRTGGRRLLGLGAALALVALLVVACGGSPPPSCTYTYTDWGACSFNNQTRSVASASPSGCTGTPVLSQTCNVQYTVALVVRNSDGSTVGNVSYTVDAGYSLTLTVSALAAKGIDTSHLADGYLVARNPDAGGFVGTFVASSEQNADKTLRLTPTSNLSLVIYGLNNSNGADYAGAFSTCTIGQDIVARQVTVRRLLPGEKPYSDSDIRVGPDQPIIDAIAMINQEFLLANGTKLAELTWTPDNAGATVAAGYYAGNGDGIHTTVSMFSFMANVRDAYAVGENNTFFIEGIEMLLMFNDIFHDNSTLTFLAIGGPSEVGKDYARFGALFARK